MDVPAAGVWLCEPVVVSAPWSTAVVSSLAVFFVTGICVPGFGLVIGFETCGIVFLDVPAGDVLRVVLEMCVVTGACVVLMVRVVLTVLGYSVPMDEPGDDVVTGLIVAITVALAVLVTSCVTVVAMLVFPETAVVFMDPSLVVSP